VADTEGPIVSDYIP